MGIAPNLIGGSAGVLSNRDRIYMWVPTTDGAGGVNRQNERLSVVGGTVSKDIDVKSKNCKPLRPRRYRDSRGPVRVGHTSAESVVSAVRRRPTDGHAHAGLRGNILSELEWRRVSTAFREGLSVFAPKCICRLRICFYWDDERKQEEQTQQTGRGEIMGGGGGTGNRCNEWSGFVTLRHSAVLVNIATPPLFYPAVTKKIKNKDIIGFLVMKKPVVKSYQNRNRAVAFEMPLFGWKSSQTG